MISSRFSNRSVVQLLVCITSYNASGLVGQGIVPGSKSALEVDIAGV